MGRCHLVDHPARQRAGDRHDATDAALAGVGGDPELDLVVGEVSPGVEGGTGTDLLHQRRGEERSVGEHPPRLVACREPGSRIARHTVAVRHGHPFGVVVAHDTSDSRLICELLPAAPPVALAA